MRKMVRLIPINLNFIRETEYRLNYGNTGKAQNTHC